MRLEVSIEQDDCTSCGKCPDIAPQHFYMADDGIAYVQESSNGNEQDPEFKGYGNAVLVLAGVEDDVIEAAEDCPGECIYVEPVDAPVPAS